MKADLVLSSGFLAFGRHAGFLSAVERAGVDVEAVMGTSSGAVAASLWAAGMKGADIAGMFARVQLVGLARPSSTPWRGVFSLDAFISMLRPHLPARFEDLPRPLAVGVVSHDGKHQVLTRGALVEAVAASCAMPWIFRAVDVDGGRFHDGGAADRLGLDAWRAWRPGHRAVAHWVDRTAGRDVDAPGDDVVTVRTPRSGARFWNLGDVVAQAAEAEDLATRALAALPR